MSTNLDRPIVDGYFEAITNHARETGKLVHMDGVEHKIEAAIVRRIQRDRPDGRATVNREPGRIDIFYHDASGNHLIEIKRQFQKRPIARDLKKLCRLNQTVEDIASINLVGCHYQTFSGPGSGRGKEEINRLSKELCSLGKEECPNFMFSQEIDSREPDRVAPKLTFVRCIMVILIKGIPQFQLHAGV